MNGANQRRRTPPHRGRTCEEGKSGGLVRLVIVGKVGTGWQQVGNRLATGWHPGRQTVRAHLDREGLNEGGDGRWTDACGPRGSVAEPAASWRVDPCAFQGVGGQGAAAGWEAHRHGGSTDGHGAGRKGGRRSGTGQGQNSRLVQWARPREDAGSCGTLLCSALHCSATQGAPGTTGRRGCIIAAGRGALREANPPSSPRESIASRTQKAGRLLVVHWVVARQALGCNTQSAARACQCTIRGTPIDSRCTDPPTSASAATRKATTMLEAVCIARRRARGHSSSIPREPGAKPAHRQRHGLLRMAGGSEQSRRPRRVRTMGAAIGTWPDTAIDSEVGVCGGRVGVSVH